jgi:hypothetical protein
VAKRSVRKLLDQRMPASARGILPDGRSGEGRAQRASVEHAANG